MGTAASPRTRRTLALAISVGLCALVGYALRLAHLGSQSIWLDEGATYHFATLPTLEIIRATFSYEPNPPLYYLLVHFWLRAAGSTELGLRFPSVVAGVLTIAVVYRAGRELLSPAAGLAAAVLTTSSAYLVWYAQEARMYALLACLAAATFLALWRAIDVSSWQRWAIFGLLALLTLYTHFFGLLVVAACGLCFFVALTNPVVRHTWWRPVCAFVAAAILYLPWLMLALRSGAAASSWRQATDVVDIAQRTLIAVVHDGALSPPKGTWLVVGEVVLAIVGLVATTRWARAKGWATTILAAAIVLPTLGMWALSTRQNLFEERYVVAQAPVFFLAVAAGATLPLRRVAPLSVMLVAVAAGASLFATATQWSDPAFRKEDFRTAAAYLLLRVSPNDALVLVADYISMPLTYYYRGPAELVPFRGSVDQPGTALQPTLDGRDSAWLVLSHSEQVDPDGHVQGWLAARYPIVTEAFPQGIRVYGYRVAYKIARLPAGTTPVHRVFGDNVELVAYTANQGIPPTDTLLHPPSNWLHVTLYWQARGRVASDYRTSVRLVDPKGVWGQSLDRTGDALSIYPTTRWQTGEIVVDDVDVNLNPKMPPGEYQLQTRLLATSGKSALPVGGFDTLGPVAIVAGHHG